MQFDHFAAQFLLKFSFSFGSQSVKFIPLPRKISDQGPVTSFGLALILWKKLDSFEVFGQSLFFQKS